MSLVPTSKPAICGVVLVVMVDFTKQGQVWGWLRMIQGTSALHGVKGLLFSKVMGSGHEGGFVLRPSPSHQGLICIFDRVSSVKLFLQSELIASYRSNAREFVWGMYSITSAKGSWDSVAWGVSDASALDGVYPSAEEDDESTTIAVLTRASIKPAHAVAFWRFAPATQKDLPAAKGCLLAMGMGEAPLLRQCTFSVWRSLDDVDSYARHGAHQKAIETSYRRDFFSESMFVRMRPLEIHGCWKGSAIDLDTSSAAKSRADISAHA
jgi:spheroidene monooxygenase